MRNLTYVRVGLFAVALVTLTLFMGASLPQPHAAPDRQSLDRETTGVNAENLPGGPLGSSGKTALDNDAEPVSSSREPVSNNATFYTVRPDLRRCASPRCGGYYVRPVNRLLVPCGNRRLMAECYVAEIDWNGQSPGDIRKALLRGEVQPRTFGYFPKLGVFRVSESWEAASDNRPIGDFYRVRDRGVRCITFPCPSYGEMKLNSRFSQNIAGVDLTGAGATEESRNQALAAMTSGEGALVAGIHRTVTGPGGRMPELRATQFYLRAGNSQALKPCRRSGCSGQVCSDKDVITTCEWRPEYACYQKSACERQADGDCGFTRTAELVACLGRK